MELITLDFSKVPQLAIAEAQERIAERELSLSSDEHSNAPRGPVNWVLSREDLLRMLEVMRNASEVVMDLETTGLDEHAVTGGTSNGGVAARVALAAITLPQKDASGSWDREEPPSYIVPLSHPDSPFLGTWRKVLGIIAKHMLKWGKPFVNAHTKFDARWIYAMTSKSYIDDRGIWQFEPGYDLTDLIAWDTQASLHLIDETQSTKLKEGVPRRFGVPRWDDHDLSYPGAAEDVDLWELGEYAVRDTYWTFRLFRAHIEQLFLDPDDPFATPVGSDEVKDARLGKIAEMVLVPTAKSLGKIEQRGMRLDLDYVHEELAKQEKIAEEALDKIAEEWRLPRKEASMAATSKWFKALTEEAVRTGDLRVMSMTKGGSPQWDKHVLKKQSRQGSELAGLILEQREAAKQSEFFRSWLEKVTPQGLIHSTYRAGHVVTGRLSSASPNMQQVSRKMKRAFLPREGYVLAEIDYSQLELRVAAFISRCQPMIDAFNADLDLHRLFAADIMTRERRKVHPSAPAVTLEEVTPDYRQRAKAGNFGLLYLQSANGFRSYADKVYGVELSEEEALEVYDGFFSTWDGMHQWHRRQVAEARARGYATSPIGRVRNLPNIADGNEYLRAEAERQAVNAPVQGFGSDLMQMAIASIFGIMPGSSRIEDAHPVATVHDSVEVELPEDSWEERLAECQNRMEHLEPYLAKMGVVMDVPLRADATVGKWWGDDSLLGE